MFGFHRSQEALHTPLFNRDPHGIVKWRIQVSAQPKSSKVRPNAVLYGAAIRACSGAGKWRIGLDLLEVRDDLVVIGRACCWNTQGWPWQELCKISKTSFFLLPSWVFQYFSVFPKIPSTWKRVIISIFRFFSCYTLHGFLNKPTFFATGWKRQRYRTAVMEAHTMCYKQYLLCLNNLP